MKPKEECPVCESTILLKKDDDRKCGHCGFEWELLPDDGINDIVLDRTSYK